MPITGLDDFIREFAAEAVELASTVLLDDASADAPVDTGELVGSAYGPVTDGLTATVGFSAPQADYTDQGTPPHVIRPSRADRLTFFWENGPDGARVYSFNEVNHPGQDATHWFSDRVDEWDDYVQRAIEDL